MKFAELVCQSRSIRRFYQDRPVALETLRELVDLARLAPTGSNRQPLRFLLSCDPARNALIFPHLGWAGYLRDWPGPVEGEPQPQLDTSQMFPAPAWTDPTRRVNFQEHFNYTVDVTRPCGH